MDFQRPSNIPDHADLCLKALSDAGLGEKISLGGAFGLLHYLDYRPTYDVDAWWASTATAQERQRVIDAIAGALRPLGEVRTRAWGDVVSIELLDDKRKTFSFQIAQRAAQLQPSAPLPWANSLLDSLDDLVASKMLALQIHLERIALHRPLAQIADATEKAEAQQLGRWFVEEFIHALPD